MMLPELPSRLIKIVLGFIGAIFIVNVLLLDFFFVSQRSSLLDFQTRLSQLSDSFRILGGRLYTASGESSPSAELAPLMPVVVNNNSCPVSCLDLISLSTSAAKLSTRSLIAPVFQSTTPTTSSTKGEFFVPLGSGSVNQTNDWTNIDSAQATFDAGNYGSIKAAYFEVFLHTQSGEVHARLFDSSTPTVFFATDLKSSSMTAQFLSAPVTLSSGIRIYKVQMYSTIASGFLDQARIRIVTQ